MTKFRRLTLFGVMVMAFFLPLAVVLPQATNAVPMQSSDKADDQGEGEENSNDRSNEAGWMQAGKVLTGSSAEAEKTTPSMQACLRREEGIHKKVTLITTKAQEYEKKLTAVLNQIVELKESYNITAPEVESSIMVANSLKTTQIEPLLNGLGSYQTDKKISCSQGVGSVVASLVKVQGVAQELRDGLADYRNSIRAVLFAVKDNVERSTN